MEDIALKKVLVWESHSMISGGQKMTLLVSELLNEEADFVYMIPGKGALSKELDRRQISYHMLGDQSMPAGVKGKSVIIRYAMLSVNAILKAIRIILKEKPDLIYAPGPAALPWSAICGLVTGKPVVWHLHHVFLDGPTKKLLNLFSGWSSVKKIIAVSNCVGTQIANASGKSKVKVLYNPVDVKKYASGVANVIYQDYPKLQTAGDRSTIILGHVALMQETKRQSVVIETVNYLKKQGYSCKAILVGGTKNEEDEKYLNRLHGLVDKNNLKDDIYFLGFRSDVPNVLACCHMVMIPSAFEGFPLAGLEANAAGLPVICADQGGSLEYARVSNSGEVFVFDNVESCAEAVIRCNSNYENIRKNAVGFAEECSVERYKVAVSNEILGNFK